MNIDYLNLYSKQKPWLLSWPARLHSLELQFSICSIRILVHLSCFYLLFFYILFVFLWSSKKSQRLKLELLLPTSAPLCSFLFFILMFLSYSIWEKSWNFQLFEYSPNKVCIFLFYFIYFSYLSACSEMEVFEKGRVQSCYHFGIFLAFALCTEDL